MVQGPCFDSQLLLINSKLLVTINDLLKYYLISETDTLKEQFPSVNIFSQSEYGDMKNNSKDKEQEDEFKESTSFKKNFSKWKEENILSCSNLKIIEFFSSDKYNLSTYL